MEAEPMVPEFKTRAYRCRDSRSAHRIASGWLQPTLAGDRRWVTRNTLHLAAEFRQRGKRRLHVTVLDFSAQGCRIATEAGLKPGNYSWITFPTLESWYSRVAWCRDGLAGLDFAQPLHPAVARMLLSRAKAATPK
jgi:hypothetical protein